MGFTTNVLSSQLLTLPGHGKDKSKPRYVIQFSAGWSSFAHGIAGGPFGLSGQGFTLDTQAIARNVVDLPQFRALELCVTFDMSTINVPDGEFIIIMESTQQTYRFAPQMPLATVAGATGVLNIVIPLVAQAPTKILFFKAANAANNMFGGTMTGTLVDFDMPSSTYFGVAAA